MSSLRKYKDEQILHAAAEAFLEHGAAASTALIAKRAGVSEGILFKRFKTKEALFEAALTSEMESDQWQQTLLASVGKGTPRSNLKKAILALFDKLQRLIPKLMILEGQGRRRPFPSGAKAPPLEDAKAITTYLKREVKNGRLRLDRPELHAHEIVGAVVHCTMLRHRHQTEIGSPEQWAGHLADVHLGNSRSRRVRNASTGQSR